MSEPDYRYGEERRQAVRMLRRVLKAYYEGAPPHKLEAIMERAREWLNEHDDMLAEDFTK